MTPLLRPAIVVLAVVGLMAALDAGPQEQNPQTATPRFFTRTTAVRVPVQVMNGNRPVTGLRPDQFVITDNGVPQTTTSAPPIGRLDLALVMDVSHSVGAIPLDALRTVAESVLTAAHVDDAVGLTAFAGSPFAVRPVSLDREAVRTGLAELSTQALGRTALWDAVVATSGAVAGGVGRPHVMVFTDGCDNASWMTPAATARWLARTDATVDIVMFGTSDRERLAIFDSGMLRHDACYGPLGLEDAVRSTGGQVFRTADRQVVRKLNERLEQLRTGYFVTYTPTDTRSKDGWHEVRITIRGTQGRVTAREGYYAGDGSD